MYHYVILESYDKGKEVERFSQEKWNEVKPRLNPLRINYVTTDLSDEKLKDYDRIVWDRLLNPITRMYEKIVIPLSSDYEENCRNAETETNRKLMLMEEKAEQIKESRELRIQRKRQENIENGTFDKIAQIRDEMNKLIPEDTEEIEALALWKASGYRQPAGRRIEELHKDYGMSWREFIKFIDTKIFKE